MDIVAGLNEAQRAAVTHGDGPLLILAGAGSGKTNVLTRRIAWLLQRGVPPDGIIALTFTNKAANEMKERVRRWAGAKAADLWVSTFHSACVRILRPHAERLGYGRSFTVVDADDQRALVRACLKDLDLSDKRFPPGAVLSAISQWKAELVTPEEALRGAGDFFRHEAARVYGRYQARLQEANAVDFDDLLMLTVRLFEQHPDVARQYADRFQHVLVDEYQDTNRTQYRIVRALSAIHRNVFVVGDADQSIYGWRGADIRNILDFERDFPDASVIRLEQNYRSTQNILDAASRVIAHNRQRREKRLWSDLGPGEPVAFHCAWDEMAEADFVVGEIERLVAREGRSYADFAVLYRTHAQSRILEEACLRRGVPYHIVGGLKFYERKEVKDVLAYVRLAANPHDWLSFERIVNVPRRGVGPATLERIRAARGVRPIYEALEEAGAIPGIQARAAAELAKLGALLRDLAERASKVPVAELVRAAIEESGYRQDLLADGSPQALARVENLDELLTVAHSFVGSEPGAQLEEFLAEVALVSEADAYDPERPAVALMTLHAAKGLEFPVVFLVGMEERVFPHGRSIDEGNVEEERRLCYVGMTRARERLYLTCARRRSLFGEVQLHEPSRFLEEVGEEFLQPVAGSPALSGLAEGDAEPLDVPWLQSGPRDPVSSWRRRAGGGFPRAHAGAWGAAASRESAATAGGGGGGGAPAGAAAAAPAP
ncbi:MAG: UvrD-helicase domain-containing protein, partial [Clostridia bacterium]|nr:UvrD-helicase domain-containing protein [Clostridia bacterium]